MELRKGMLAISKAGHDKDSWYIVLSIEGNHVFLVNGKNRTLDRPKMKKRMHLQPVNTVPKALQEKLNKPRGDVFTSPFSKLKLLSLLYIFIFFLL